jgi:hypothetical protein
MKNLIITSFAVFIFLAACSPSNKENESTALTNKYGQQIYQDTFYMQDYSIKFYLPKDKKGKVELFKVASDRNENIQITSSYGLLFPYNGHFMTPGELLPERTYQYMINKNISGIFSYKNQFVYTDDNAIFSNAWAGTIYNKHSLKKPKLSAGGSKFDFMISDGESITYLNSEGKIWNGSLTGISSIKFNKNRNNFLIVTSNSVSIFAPQTNKLNEIYKSDGITCATPAKEGTKIVVGTNKGYRWLNSSGQLEGNLVTKVPWPEITDVEEIDGSLWFGSTWGAYKLKEENKYDYYSSQRWLPDNRVKDIEPGPDGSVLVLTETGLGQICFKEMTLHEKAMELEKITRKHFIRYGFSSRGGGMKNGHLGQLTIHDSDNDGLWTGMYLGGQIFRYAVTKDPEAWENCKEALMGFERLYSITGIPGLPARAYEVMGYESSGYTNAYSEATKHLFEGSGYDVESSPWRKGTDKGWVWKSTTSSDEIVGHFFALSLFADLADDPEWKKRGKKLVVALAEHIYKNDLYLFDWNGKPTTWGKWNPEYTNSYPTNVGDRKLTSSNIVAFLQAGYHFTGDEKYKNKILDLFENHGYLENLMRPMDEIGKVDKENDDGKIESWAEMLSDSWNHSDDEMYFCGYWSLYSYALNDTLQVQFKESIRDHWEIERPEKEPVMNLTYALTGAKDFDLDEIIWWLQKHPIDHINWRIENSHRHDIEKLPKNFREQYTKDVLSPAEVGVRKHNANRFDLDRRGNGSSAETPGDVWLLPYWMGRYLDVISAPIDK